VIEENNPEENEQMFFLLCNFDWPGFSLGPFADKSTLTNAVFSKNATAFRRQPLKRTVG